MEAVESRWLYALVRAMMRGYSYGKHGFKRPASVSRDATIVNVGKLDELALYLVEKGLRK